MNPDRLGEHFTLAEFLATSRPELQGDPTCAQIAAMTQLVCKVLDPTREALGRPMRVTSGFRSVRLNQAIGGSRTSDHMAGRAADVKVDGMTSRELATVMLELGVPFDQLIWYAEARGGHVHVSYRPRGNRGQVKHAPEGGGYPPRDPRSA